MICIFLFILIGKTDFRKNDIKESIKFSNIYRSVPEENLYVFSNASLVNDILNGRSGVILMSFPTNKWTDIYASILNDGAKEVGIDKIYYYNFLEDRDERNATYETIVNKLSRYAYVNDEGKQNIYAPTILIVKKGMIIAYFDGLSVMRGNQNISEYFAEEKDNIYEKIKQALLEYIY